MKSAVLNGAYVHAFDVKESDRKNNYTCSECNLKVVWKKAHVNNGIEIESSFAHASNTLDWLDFTNSTCSLATKRVESYNKTYQKLDSVKKVSEVIKKLENESNESIAEIVTRMRHYADTVEAKNRSLDYEMKQQKQQLDDRQSAIEDYDTELTDREDALNKKLSDNDAYLRYLDDTEELQRQKERYLKSSHICDQKAKEAESVTEEYNEKMKRLDIHIRTKADKLANELVKEFRDEIYQKETTLADHMRQTTQMFKRLWTIVDYNEHAIFSSEEDKENYKKLLRSVCTIPLESKTSWLTDVKKYATWLNL